MGNRRRTDVLDTLIDTIILRGPIKRVDTSKETGIALKTVDEWIDIIMKIQAMPLMLVEGEGRNMVFSLDISKPEDTHLENAMAFYSQTHRSVNTPIDKRSEEPEH